jgi:hypothetical protein
MSSTIPKRPDTGGTKGKQLNVKINIFPVASLATAPVYHYDIAITPDVPPVKSRLVWQQVELELGNLYGSLFLAYDGCSF